MAVKGLLRVGAAILFMLGMATSNAYELTLTGRIVSVADGDTVTLLDANLQQHKLRLSGIDAPRNASRSATAHGCIWAHSSSAGR